MFLEHSWNTRTARSFELMSLKVAECVPGMFQEQEQPDKIYVSHFMPKPMVRTPTMAQHRHATDQRLAF